MIYRLSLLILCLSAKGFSVEAQLPDTLLVPVHAQRLEVDNLQNSYLIDSLQTVRKYSPAGNLQFQYTNLSLGRLDLLDVTDPFRLLLYYPEYQTIVELDRTLNERSRLFLPEAGFPMVDCIGRARDGGVWAYDGLNNQLTKIDKQGATTTESQNLSFLPEGAPTPTALIAAGNFVYMYDQTKGVLLFDAFGQYIRTTALRGKKIIQKWNDHLLVWDGAKLFLLSERSTLREFPLEADLAEANAFRLVKDRLFLLYPDRLVIRKWKK